MVKYTKELLEPLVKESFSISEVLRKMGSNPSCGGVHRHVSKVIKKMCLDTSHFNGRCWRKGKSYVGKSKSWEEILVCRNVDYRQSAWRLRKALIESGMKYQCVKCGLEENWQNKELRLQINHKNGKCNDDSKDNLEFLCPNCHSQTANFGRNKGYTKLTTHKQNRNK